MLVVVLARLIGDAQGIVGQARPTAFRKKLQSIAHRLAQYQDAPWIGVFDKSSGRYTGRKGRRAGQHDDFALWRNQRRQVACESVGIEVVAAAVVAQIQNDIARSSPSQLMIGACQESLDALTALVGVGLQLNKVGARLRHGQAAKSDVKSAQ